MQTLKDNKEKVAYLKTLLATLKSTIDTSADEVEIMKLEAASTDPDFWNDPLEAKNVMQDIASLKDSVSQMVEFEENVNLIVELEKEGQLDGSYQGEVDNLTKIAEELKKKSLLSGIYDKKNAIMSINAGQGGTEAMDWAGMLYRMYLRFAEKKGWTTETVDYSPGEEAGIKSVTFKVYGPYVFGYLKGETGTHRLVRQSPFNADNLRQTSFALVGVLPEIAESDAPSIEIKDIDLDWQFFHASSKGGQNVQKVSTAVRLKHLPTGITVTAQTERFQEQNRKIALDLLRAKLWILEEERKKNLVGDIKGEYKPASWGNQIRSYVLHPYKMVKDLRTNVESSNPTAVLDGELDEFVNEELTLSI